MLISCQISRGSEPGALLRVVWYLRISRILDILFWLFYVIEIPADAKGAGELRFCMFVISGLQAGDGHDRRHTHLERD